MGCNRFAHGTRFAIPVLMSQMTDATEGGRGLARPVGLGILALVLTTTASSRAQAEESAWDRMLVRVAPNPADAAPLPSATTQADLRWAQAIYDENFIGFYASPGDLTGAGAKLWKQPWQGAQRKLLRGASFYEAIGRHDLASRYRQNLGWKVATTVIGSLVVGYGAYSAYKESSAPADQSILKLEGVGGMLLVTGGAVLAILPWFWSCQPIDAVEARRLAAEHNQRLKVRLGLAANDGSSEDAKPEPVGARVTLTVAPFASPQGGGLGLAGAF